MNYQPFQCVENFVLLYLRSDVMVIKIWFIGDDLWHFFYIHLKLCSSKFTKNDETRVWLLKWTPQASQLGWHQGSYSVKIIIISGCLAQISAQWQLKILHNDFNKLVRLLKVWMVQDCFLTPARTKNCLVQVCRSPNSFYLCSNQI